MFYITGYPNTAINLNEVRNFRAYRCHLEFNYENLEDSVTIEYKSDEAAAKAYTYILDRVSAGDKVIYEPIETHS